MIDFFPQSTTLTNPMAEPKENPLMEKIVSLCKRRGFVFQSSEIYGGSTGFGITARSRGTQAQRQGTLWHAMTRQRDDVAGLEATIIMSPQIWKASGHVDTFADLMRECPITNKRFRADQVEPQSGWVFSYSGARSRAIEEIINKASGLREVSDRVWEKLNEQQDFEIKIQEVEKNMEKKLRI